MPRCIVNKCPHWTGRKGSEDVILHIFPNDIKKIKIWLLQINQNFGNIDEFAQKVLEGNKNRLYRICSSHFTSDCYVKKKKNKFLKKAAVPTVFEDINTSMDPVICPPSKRPRTEDFVVESSTSSRILMPIMRDSQTQTDTFSQTFNGTVKDMACMTNPKFISKSSGTQIDRKYLTSNCSIQCELLLPIPENTNQEKAGIVQMDHFYPKCFSTPFKIGQEAIDDQEFQKENSINTVNISQIRSEPVSFSCLDSTIESTGQGKDEDFEPLTEFENTETTFEEEVKNEKDLIKERKFMVFESCLDVLFFKVRCGFSIDCTSPIEKFDKKIIGSSLSVTATCISGHEFQLWQSQPRIKNVPAGNILLSCAILCSGASFQKVDDMFNILGLLHISKTTYYRFQREYLFQAIDRQWLLEQESLRTQLSEKALCVAGDGQYDSLGHCAKYCIYSMMDMVSEKILHFQILQISKKKTSGVLEKEAFIKCLKKIQDDGFDVQIVATDRHSGIKKAVLDEFKALIHQYDTWHFTKSLRKKLVAASKRRLCKPLSDWIQPLVNHFWWSAQTCGGDVDVLKEKWNSALNHIQGIHEWEDGLGGCAHDTLTEEEQNETQWLKKSDPAYESLLTIFNDPRFDKDIEHLQRFCHTGVIEVFHSKTTSFRPKRIHFKMDSMEARTKLAALSHNRNVNRKQATIKDRRRSALHLGQKRFSYLCPKWKKTWIARPIYEPTKNDFVFHIIEDVIDICLGNISSSWESQAASLPKNIAPLERPDKEEILKEHLSRFNK